MIYLTKVKANQEKRKNIVCFLPYISPWLLQYIDISDEFYLHQKILSNEDWKTPQNYKIQLKTTEIINTSVFIILSYFSEWFRKVS